MAVTRKECRAAPLRILATALGLLGAAACGGAGASPDRVVQRTEHYSVDGTSARDLRWAMDRLGPPNAEGGRSDAITKWDFEYTFGLEERSGRCRMSSLETATTITTILPRWSPAPSIAPALVTYWSDYVACAALHEAGHRRIYLDGVADLRRRAGELGEFASCEAATAAIDSLAGEVRRGIDAAQSEYEKRTNHGYVQCGRFG